MRYSHPQDIADVAQRNLESVRRIIAPENALELLFPNGNATSYGIRVIATGEQLEFVTTMENREFHACRLSPPTTPTNRDDVERKRSELRTYARKYTVYFYLNAKTERFRRIWQFVRCPCIAGMSHQPTSHPSASFNAKIKNFRALQRGVSDITFFLYRLSMIYG